MWSDYYPLTAKTKISRSTFFKVAPDAVGDFVVLLGSSRQTEMRGADILPKIPERYETGMLMWIAYLRHNCRYEEELQNALDELSGDYPDARVLR